MLILTICSGRPFVSFIAMVLVLCNEVKHTSFTTFYMCFFVVAVIVGRSGSYDVHVKSVEEINLIYYQVRISFSVSIKIQLRIWTKKVIINLLMVCTCLDKAYKTISVNNSCRAACRLLHFHQNCNVVVQKNQPHRLLFIVHSNAIML